MSADAGSEPSPGTSTTPATREAHRPAGAAGRPVAVFALHPHLISEIFPAEVLDRLQRSVTCDPTAALTEVATPTGRRLLRQADILLSGWGCPLLDADAVRLAPRLRAAIHAAGSVKGHVTPELFAAGVMVSSAAGVNARPVAEFTVASIVLAARRTFVHAAAYRAGRPAQGYLPGDRSGLCGSTIGVIGASRTGRLVLELLADYDVHCLVHDPYVQPAELRALGAEPADLDTLCRQSDVVTVHAPELPETRQLIDAGRLAQMRDGAVLINTARGSLVDTEALTEHCAAGRLDAVLDVTDPEPLPADHRLLTLPNVLVTPHLAGSRGRELRRFGEFVTAEVERLLAGRPLLGLVEPGDLPRLA